MSISCFFSDILVTITITPAGLKLLYETLQPPFLFTNLPLF